jgi:hypothetical protein
LTSTADLVAPHQRDHRDDHQNDGQRDADHTHLTCTHAAKCTPPVAVTAVEINFRYGVEDHPQANTQLAHNLSSLTKDRGCSAPGCTAPGYQCEVHHVEEWAAGGRTDIDDLTFACRPDHRLLTPGGWTTRKHPDGTTEWIPPPQLPLPGGTNDYHHPENYLPRDK